MRAAFRSIAALAVVFAVIFASVLVGPSAQAQRISNPISSAQPVDANARAIAWRQCATRAYMPRNNISGAGRWQMTRGYHVSRGCAGPVIACFMYGKVANNTETLYTGGSLKVGMEAAAGATPTLSLENIAAGNAPVPFPSTTPPNGNPTMTVPPGQTCLTWNVSIPDGTAFAFRPLQQGANVVFKAYQSDASSGTSLNEGWESGTGTVSDKTTSGTFSNNVITFGPTLILAQTTRPAFLIYGDSTEEAGDGYVSDKSGDVGPTATAVGRLYGYTSFAEAAQSLSGFLPASRTLRDGVIPYFTHIVDRWGINDLGTGGSAATLAANRATFAALYPSATVIGGTLMPYLGTTDGYKTAAGQNLASGNNIKVMDFNRLVRAGITGEKILWDYADAIDPGRNGTYPVQRNVYAANDTNTAQVVGSMAAGSSVLTVSGVTSGTLKVGDTLVSSQTGAVGNGLLDSSMMIVSQLTGTTGGVGTYQMAKTQMTAVASGPMYVGGYCTRDGLHATQACMEIMSQTIRVNLGGIKINRVDWRDLPRTPANENGAIAETMAG